jgi:hypothetical protein
VERQAASAVSSARHAARGEEKRKRRLALHPLGFPRGRNWKEGDRGASSPRPMTHDSTVIPGRERSSRTRNP